MSARFGHDFSSVRIHTDARAGDSAVSVGANAYATGNDIVFGADQWTPGSPQTERLLAHELTHVVQQAQGGPGDSGRVSSHADASEREADFLASEVTSGRAVTVQAAPSALIARDEDEQNQCRPMPSNPFTAFGATGNSLPVSSQSGGTSSWQAWDDNPAWNFTTNDAVSGTVGMAQTHLGNLHKSSAGESIAAENAMQDEFRLRDYSDNHSWSMNQAGTAEEVGAQKSLWRAGAAVEEDVSGAMQVARTAENTVSRFSPALGVAQNVSRVLSPLGMYSDGKSLIRDVRNGNYADAAADGLGLTASTIGTVEAAGAALTATGAVGAGGALSGAAATLNPVGAVAGSAAGGYALGKAALGEANDHAKKTQLFGKGEDGQIRDSTDEAADMGLMMKQFYGGGTLGNIAGAGTAIGASWGTAAYSLADEASGGGIGYAVNSLFGDDDDMVPLGPVIMQQMQQMQQITGRGNGQAK